MMISVCFVCLGNICRSPMAELIFKKMVEERGVSHMFSVTSCGTEAETGCSVYPNAKRTLERHGVSGNHIARQLEKSDIINNDYILVMDAANLFDVLRVSGGAFSDKVYKLTAFCRNPRDVSDPWYTRDFEKAYADIYEGCERFLDFLLSDNN